MEFLNEKSYPLNKSNTKSISIGLSKISLQPTIAIIGIKQKVIFNEDDWKRINFYKPLLTAYFTEADSKWAPIYDSFTIEFHNFRNKKIIKLYKDKELCVYLALETITGIWGLVNLINTYLSILHKQSFATYYSNIIKTNNLSLLENTSNIINFVNIETDGDNAYTLMEIMQFYPEKVIVDVEIANTIKL